MSFFSKLFGKAKPPPVAPPSRPLPLAPPLPPPSASPPPPGAPATLKVWDAYGRSCVISREEWRTKVLPASFQKNWRQPEELASLINASLNDGFIPDCLAAARQLHKIDPQPRRGATLLAIVLLQLKQFGEAEKIIGEALRRHGEDGVLLTNLAKAQLARGQESLSEATLWHALEIDPNQNNGFGWYISIHRERGGETAALAAMRRVADQTGSWRAQLWLARVALESRDIDAAMVLYQIALDRAGEPAPTELLYQMSGDLGNAAHLPELLRLTEPHFNAALHGLMVGNNLIKAHLDLAQFAAAGRILDQLYAQQRADWKQPLAFWDAEIARVRLVIAAPDRPAPLKMALFTIEGPIWLKPASPAAELFPAAAAEDVTLAFLGCTAEVDAAAGGSPRCEHQLADGPSRLSRSLPLFLAEQVAFHSGAQVQTLIPTVVGDPPGFVLNGVPWNDQDAASYARQGQAKSDYIVTTHIQPQAEPWTAQLRLVRTIDGQCLGQLTATWPAARPELGIPQMARQLLTLLAEHAELSVCPPPPAYQVPVSPHFAAYLLRLEQLLAIRFAGMQEQKNGFLSGERAMVDGNLQLSLKHEQNIGVRILLAQTLVGLKKVRPDILPEFTAKIALLQKEKPLPEPAHSVVQRLFNEAFAS
jgi:tetratricopeptide (TPR) repeat protein